jgi:tetratricopeptide (TPR) repeat protein
MPGEIPQLCFYRCSMLNAECRMPNENQNSLGIGRSDVPRYTDRFRTKRAVADRPLDKNTALAALTPPSASLRDVLPLGGGPSSPQFAPGDLFAGRYRMITLVGHGASGEIWRADDLILQTNVALKILRSTSDEARERVFDEVRLARQITHPAVCRVFDIGQADGRAFYSMELVDGEDLATLLRRAGRFAPEKVIDVARQLSAALAAAHAQGVLHRDLKPADVLIDSSGLVRVTDFGVALPSDDPAPRPAPHPYLAPEQRAGWPASERSDVYAAGVILYELLVGQRPFADGASGPPAVKPSLLVDGVDPRLERTILRALDPDPKRRPAGAAAFARLLDTPVNHTLASSRLWMAGAVLALVVGAIALLSSWWPDRAAHVLTDQDTIVVADFLNTTGEPVFDGALKVALAVGLEQSPFVKVYPDERVQETLRLMERPANERVTRDLAREIARRDQLKALVAGSIARLGTQYVIAIEAVNAATGDVMARQQVEASTREEVLASLGTAVSKLRERLGESLSSVARFDVPLARATTPSLDALHAYSLALDEGRVVPRAEAIPHLLRAIELDPNFALAQAMLSGVYWNINRSAEAPVYSRRAFELRDRVSERERFFISWRYYVDAAQAWDQALELAQSWTTTYPREAFAFNSLGLATGTFGRHDRAADAFREAIRLDAQFVPPYPNLAGSLIALNRFDEAASTIADARTHGIDSSGLRRAAYNIALVKGDAAAAVRELSSARSGPVGIRTIEWEAQTAAFSGRFQAAHDHFQRGVQALLGDSLPELAAQWTMEDAETHAIGGECGDARREVTDGLRLSRDSFTLHRAARTMALCGDASGVAALSSELTKRFPDATLTRRVELPVAAAALALQQGEAMRALELLDPVAPYDHATYAEFWPAYLRGEAHLRLGAGRDAAAEFDSILEHRGEAVTSPLYPLAHLGRARAANLNGDTATARREYDALFALWKDADADLRPLTDARRESGRLR